MSAVGPLPRAGQYIGCLGIAGLTNGEWNDLTSASFQNVGNAVATMLPASLKVASVTVIVDAATADCFVRLFGSATNPGAADATTNFPKVSAGAALTLDAAGLQQNSGGGVLTGISIYKTAGATGRIIAYFDAVHASEPT